MRSTVLRLVALVALLLMPAGMASASAAAHHGGAVSAMAMSHCPDSSSKPDAKGGFAECTMACSAALPAVDVGASLPPRFVCPRVVPGKAQILTGLYPETATPPPKLS